jgi:D-glycero-D-manno-heptose 1,7-bisphosphate phosphatase
MFTMNRAVFIDKDGTLIEDVPYNVNPELIRLQDNAGESLRTLKDRGYLLIVISNQSGVARGYFMAEDLKVVVEKIQDELAKENVQLDGLYFCPHHPEGTVKDYAVQCECRKPKPGMIMEAAKSFRIHLPTSWMIGDILHDVEAGNKAGCRTILIDNGNETEWNMTAVRKPSRIVKNLSEATAVILESELQLWNQ